MANYNISDAVWEHILNEHCCRASDITGNRPCDNGVICDKCESKFIKELYAKELQRARETVRRFKVGDMRSVEDLYGFGENTIKILSRNVDQVTYCHMDDPGTEYTVQVQYDYCFDPDADWDDPNAQMFCCEAIMAWDYTPEGSDCAFYAHWRA